MALLELIALFFVARVFGEMCSRARVPPLAGEIAAGALLGPLVLGLVQPGEGIQLVADLGIFFLVYAAGMEMTFRGVRRTIKESAAAVAAGSFALPFLLGFLVGLAFGLEARVSLFLGLALSLTALPVSVRILRDVGWLGTDVGHTIITAGLLCDVAGLTVLAGLVGSGTTIPSLDPWTTAQVALKVALFFLTVFSVERVLRLGQDGLGRWLARRSDRWHSRGATFSLPIIIVFAFAVYSEFLGLHFVVGTFFGSVIVAEYLFPKKEGERLRESIAAISDGFLAPFFFAYLGLIAVAFTLEAAPLLLVLLLVAVAGKVGGSYAGARLAGYGPWSSKVVAVGMNGRGAMELVIALVGLELGIITGVEFSILVVLGLVTTVMTPFLLRWFARGAQQAMAAAPSAAPPNT